MVSLLHQAVERLSALVRTSPCGAKSLAHVAVVVPTAQSGRRLRRALAEKFGALVPPLVKMPYGMLLDEADPTLAGRTDELLAFADALDCPSPGREARPVRNSADTPRTGIDRQSRREAVARVVRALAPRPIDQALVRARQLSDLRALLAPKALSFADVAELIKADLPEEAERWRELAEIEVRYLDALARRGKRDRIAAMKAFKPDFPGIETILRFDDPTMFLGAQPHTAAASAAARPSDSPTLPRSGITPCSTPADEAVRIADYFASVKPTEALPALCIADPEFFPEIETAFKAKGLKIHNPAATRLVTSSLGHLVAQIVALLRTQSYSVFSAFIRGGDVRRWLCRELKLTDEDMTAALVDLDNRQAEFLPEKIDDIAPKTEKTLRAIFEFVKVQLRKKGLRAMLASIFRDFTLDERDPGAREFAAAAEAVNDLITECLVRGTDPAYAYALFELRLEETTYSLEPDEGDVILTDGWMELPFLEADELVIAGFREGCVPESTVGHPFLPDSLRHRLGLPDNAFKEARDRAILRLAVQTRAENAVRVFFHAINAQGDVLKPSRLLFETDDDADLIVRVKAFYGVRAGTAEGSATDLPKQWKLALPVPPAYRELSRISPTRLDGYLRCPFTFYLRDKEILGDKRMDDRAEELASWEYGNVAHEALEAFGNDPLKDSTDAEAIRAFLEEHVDAQLVTRFGTAIPAIVAMQGESVKRRLANFARIQAERRAAGWRIVAVERKLEIEYQIGHPVRLYGKCDRIDFNETTGEWCVIDYKTWDKADKAKSFETKRDGSHVWKSLQLPIYCAMLDMDAEAPFDAAKRDQISACYCVLGKTMDDVVFTEPMSGEYVPDAEAVIRELVPKIERGIFWPPAPTREWKYDYADWLQPNPESSVSEEWIADQKMRSNEGGQETGDKRREVDGKGQETGDRSNDE